MAPAFSRNISPEGQEVGTFCSSLRCNAEHTLSNNKHTYLRQADTAVANLPRGMHRALEITELVDMVSWELRQDQPGNSGMVVGDVVAWGSTCRSISAIALRVAWAHQSSMSTLLSATLPDGMLRNTRGREQVRSVHICKSNWSSC